MTGDRNVVNCIPGARGTFVLMTILTPVGSTDLINVCEIQVFGKY